MAPLFLIKTDRSPAPTLPGRGGRPQPSVPIRSQREAEDQFQTERGMALFIIAVAAVYLRAVAPLFSTAYMDESIYVLYGRMFLARRFEAPLDSPLQWSFGWYLWPAMAAIADRIGGLIALRETAAVLGTVTVAATYGFASRIFSKAVGLGAAAVMAVLAPAVLVSRIATRDSGAICFVALGLWAFACGWREEKKRWWLLATLFCCAAFLCKYLIAIYFPLLVLVALKKGKKPLLCFSLPLFLCCVVYGAIYHKDILYLLRYASAYGSLKAPGAQALGIYFWGRWDFWLLCLAALPVFASREWRAAAALLWTGTLVMLVFQWKTRADYDYWKHVNYSLLFLVPLAVAGVVFLATRLQKVYYRQMLWGVSMVVALAGGVFFLGLGQSVERFVFWPNVSPILAYFENRLTPNDKVLVDDTVLRYYFSPPLHQYQIVDPMYIQYGQNIGPEAYKSAVGERSFSYIVLDEGIGQEAQIMDAAIRPLLDSYQLELEALEPTLGHKIEIYA